VENEYLSVPLSWEKFVFKQRELFRWKLNTHHCRAFLRAAVCYSICNVMYLMHGTQARYALINFCRAASHYKIKKSEHQIFGRLEGCLPFYEKEV